MKNTVTQDSFTDTFTLVVLSFKGAALGIFPITEPILFSSNFKFFIDQLFIAQILLFSFISWSQVDLNR